MPEQKNNNKTWLNLDGGKKNKETIESFVPF